MQYSSIRTNKEWNRKISKSKKGIIEQKMLVKQNHSSLIEAANIVSEGKQSKRRQLIVINWRRVHNFYKRG